MMSVKSDPITKTVKHDTYEVLTDAVVEMRQECLYRNGSAKLWELSGSIEKMLNYWLSKGETTATFEEVIEVRE